ncbi:MAG: hypothetical protein Q9175_001836 [Cornicularia normoerica]
MLSKPRKPIEENEVEQLLVQNVQEETKRVDRIYSAHQRVDNRMGLTKKLTVLELQLHLTKTVTSLDRTAHGILNVIRYHADTQRIDSEEDTLIPTMTTLPHSRKRQASLDPVESPLQNPRTNGRASQGTQARSDLDLDAGTKDSGDDEDGVRVYAEVDSEEAERCQLAVEGVAETRTQAGF